MTKCRGETLRAPLKRSGEGRERLLDVLGNTLVGLGAYVFAHHAVLLNPVAEATLHRIMDARADRLRRG